MKLNSTRRVTTTISLNVSVVLPDAMAPRDAIRYARERLQDQYGPQVMIQDLRLRE
jgi:hypothetical protein